MDRLRKAVVFSTVEQQLGLIANFVIAVISSRLLAPSEIGISLVGVAIVSLVTALREFAPPAYFIKSDQLSPDEEASAVTVTLLWNIFLTGGLALASPLVSALYADGRLTPYLRVVALALMIEAFATPIIAYLRRDMRFDKVAAISSVGSTVLIITTLGLAAGGVGYMSFAWGLLGCTTATALTAIVLKPRFWLFWPRLDKARNIVNFGRYTGVNSLLRQCYDSLPYLVLGHVLPFEAVAFYHRALMLAQLPGKFLLSGVEAFMLPVLTAEVRNGRSLQSPFLSGIEFSTAVYWPTLVVLTILAPTAICLLYGPAWLPAVPYAQIMMLAALFTFINRLDVSALVASGGVRDVMMRSLAVFPLCALISTCSAFFGLQVLALSNWVTSPLQLAISAHYLFRNLKIPVSDVARSMLPSAIMTLTAGMGPLACVAYWGADLDASEVILASLLAVAGWVIGIYLTNHPLKAEIHRAITLGLARRPANRS